MKRGTIILLVIIAVLAIIYIAVKSQQKTTPTFTLGDLFTNFKTSLGIS